jgi:hypothetical protein
MRAWTFLLLTSCAGAPAEPGWIDLMPDGALTGWRRVPIEGLAEKPVWTLSPEGTLKVDGVDAWEMLLTERRFGDGVLRVEWRFRKLERENPVYNGGVYVRTALDGKHWVQAQAAHVESGPGIGDLFAMVPASGEPKRVEALQSGPGVANPPGEWNAYEITCLGKSVALDVNGKPAARWEECPFPDGSIGLQAERAFYEVRCLKFRPLP